MLVEPVVEQTSSPEPVQTTASGANDGEKKWGAKDAWKYIGMFLLLDFVMWNLSGALRLLWPSFRVWSHTGAGHFCFSIIYFTVYLLNMFYFARIERLRELFQLLGLERSPSSSVWFAIVAALAIRVIGHVIIASGWSHGATSQSIAGFLRTFGPEKYLYLAPALMAPFAEELFMRGFLYRAFRGSYSIGVSIALIVAFTAYTHHRQFTSSWAAAVVLSAITILQCMLRERTGNLWDCIASHLVFNITGAFGRFLFR